MLTKKSASDSAIKSKHFSMLLGVLVLFAVVTIVPQAFAQGMYSGSDYTNADNPHGPMEPTAIGVGIACAAVMSGVGVFSMRKRV